MIAAAARPATPAARAGKGAIGVLAVAHGINDSYGYMLQALLPAIIGGMGLSLGMAGTLVSVYMLISSVVQPVVGFWADKGGVRWPAWAGVAMSGIGAGLMGMAPNYAALCLLLMIGGMGTAIFHPVTGAMVGAAAPPEQRGRWMGMYVTAGNVGLALGPLILGIAVDQLGAPGIWPLMIPALFAAAVVLVYGPQPRPRMSGGATLMDVLREHRRVLTALITVVTVRAWVNAALVTFIPLLGVARGLSLSEAAGALTLFSLSGAAGGLTGGWVADRAGRDRTIVASFILSVPFGLLIALRPEIDAVFYVAAACCGFLLNASFVVLTIRGQESIPGNIGMVAGITLGLSIGLGGLAIGPMGALADVVGLPSATAVAASLALVGAAAMRLFPPLVRPRSKGPTETRAAPSVASAPWVATRRQR